MTQGIKYVSRSLSVIAIIFSIGLLMLARNDYLFSPNDGDVSFLVGFEKFMLTTGLIMGTLASFSTLIFSFFWQKITGPYYDFIYFFLAAINFFILLVYIFLIMLLLL